MNVQAYIEEHREEILEAVRAEARSVGWEDPEPYVLIYGVPHTPITVIVNLCPDEVKVWFVGPSS